jgi:hypothetical protein
MLRFARLGDQIIAFSRINVYKGGKGKRRKVRLFSHQGPITDLDPEEFQAAVMAGKIERLDLPTELREDAEELSEEIGPTYTPQEALQILQSMIQDHPTTLSAEVVGR